MHKFIYILLLLLTPGLLHAQKKPKRDTLALIREFIALSNEYKKVPLALDIELINHSNLILSEEDSAHWNAQFYLQPHSSYVRFGELEQVVSDSIALLVSDRLQQMIVYPDAAPIVNRMRQQLGMNLPDSSVVRLGEKYESELDPTKPLIRLTHRQVITGTDMPKETIELYYDPVKRFPRRVITVQRALIPLNEEQLTQVKMNDSLTPFLLLIEGRTFLVRERTSEYRYRKIERPSESVLPVRIEDRVQRSATGQYVPAASYSHYLVSQD